MSDENGNSTDNGQPPDNGVADNSQLGRLPLRKRRELARAVDLIREEFAAKLKNATSQERRNARLLKILLFGSTARGDWVEDPEGGYYSDYDLLLIVNKDVLTEHEFLDQVQSRIDDAPDIRTDVSIIIHTLTQVNAALRDGDYFFADIYHDHVPLWELIETKNQGRRKYNLHPPGKADPVRAYEIAQAEFENYKEQADTFYKAAKMAIDLGRLKPAAFQLHQAAEHSYAMYLLVRTAYLPKTHKLKKLRAVAEDHDARFMDVWPRVRPFKGYFAKLDEAYVKARYQQRTYFVTKEQIAWMLDRVEALFDLASTITAEYLDVLKGQAAAEQARRDKENGGKKK